MLESRKAQIREILLTLNIQPFPEQEPLLWSEAKEVVVSAGEGAGKSTLAALRAMCWGLTDPNVHLGWVLGAVMEDANKELVGTSPDDISILRLAEQLGVLDRDRSTISSHADQTNRLHLHAPATTKLPALDLTIVSISGYDPVRVGRDEPDFIIGAEISNWDVELWHRAEARLRKPGSWGYFSGSPESDRHWFPEIVKMGLGPNELNVASFVLPSSVNRVLFPEGEDSPFLVKRRLSMTTDRYAARHLGMPTATRDVVLPEFKHHLHIHPVTYAPGYPVYVGIDPGTKVYAAEFVQVVGEEVHVLEGEVFLARPTHEQVIQAAMNRPMWKYVREGVMDVAGRQNHFGMGTPEEAWVRETGLRLRLQYHKLHETVERLRSSLMVNQVTGRPRLLIHPANRGLISELGGGPSPIEGGGPWRMSNGVPRDDNCDAAKAVGYWLLANFGTTRPSAQDEGTTISRSVTYLTNPNKRRAEALQSLLDRSR